MVTYGIPYQGSKNQSATWIMDKLPAGDVLVDLMAGGCAITHAAAVSGKWQVILCNDIGDGPQLFRDAVAGRYRDERRWISREAFFDSKDRDPYIKYCWSFSNNGRDYIYSRDVEPRKKLLHEAIMADTPAERLAALRQYMRSGDTDGYRCAHLERLQRLQGLEGLPGSERIQYLRQDYREVQIPAGAVVYCDPPYKGTSCGSYDGFDHDAFDEWLADVSYPVYISEYTAPPGCVEIGRRYRQALIGTGNKGGRQWERLYVQERFTRRQVIYHTWTLKIGQELTA